MIVTAPPEFSGRIKWEDRTHTRRSQMQNAEAGYYELSIFGEWVGMVGFKDTRWHAHVWVDAAGDNEYGDWEEVGTFDTLDEAKAVCTAAALLGGS